MCRRLFNHPPAVWWTRWIKSGWLFFKRHDIIYHSLITPTAVILNFYRYVFAKLQRYNKIMLFLFLVLPKKKSSQITFKGTVVDQWLSISFQTPEEPYNLNNNEKKKTHLIRFSPLFTPHPLGLHLPDSTGLVFSSTCKKKNKKHSWFVRRSLTARRRRLSFQNTGKVILHLAARKKNLRVWKSAFWPGLKPIS